MRQKGFTLVELLVAIGIIGILSSIAVVSVGNVRAKARDAKRVGDIKQIQIGLEAYLSDKGKFPAFQGDLGVGAAGNRGSNQINKLCDTDTGFDKDPCAGTTYMNPVPANPTPHASTQNTEALKEADQYIYASKDDTAQPKVCTPGSICAAYRIIFRLESGSGTLTKGMYEANENGIVRIGELNAAVPAYAPGN